MTPWLLSFLLLAPAQDSSDPVVDFRVSASVVADMLPKQEASELRPQVAGTLTLVPSRRFSLRLEATAEALVAKRGSRIDDAAIRVRDAWVEVHGSRADLRAGYGRLVWGRLDEISPSDVINPLDAATFLFEGRSEARLAVPFARIRILPSDRLTFEGVIVPRFTRGTFDLLDEDSSPFNLVNDIVRPAGVTVASGRRHIEPRASVDNVSGGGRMMLTLGRLDVAASAYRGFEAFGPLLFEIAEGPVAGQPATTVVGELVERHPRFTMYAGDFETVSGPWALRGEVALFPEKTFAAVSSPGLVKGRAIDAGIGIDRQAGSLHLFASLLAHRESSDVDPGIERTDLNVIGSVDRSFSQERGRTRAFIVVNPRENSAFLRGLMLWKLHDRVAIEFSGGSFIGTSRDTIGRFNDRDFLAARLRYDLR